MPISDYQFSEGIFSAKESGIITPQEAREWADRLEQAAAQSPTPIVALVDALSVKQIAFGAYDIFSKASYTPNVLRVVVATNAVTSGSSTNIGLLGKRHQTEVFRTLEEAREHARSLAAENNAPR